MEKINFVKNGVIKLPPGFRFHPTDEELVVQYLKRKVFAYPLPASIIPEVDVCKYNPWDLPGDSEQERYFFSTREAKYRNGNRPNRAAGCGHWKATGVDKKIVVSRSNQVVGMKKTLVFYRGKTPSRSRTDWIMHEYRLVGDASTQNSMTQIGDWVLCRIFLKQRNNKNDDDIAQPCNKHRVLELRVARPNHFIDFMMQDKTSRSPSSYSSSSSSSASSGITEVSSPESDHEENSSCNSVTASPCRRQP